VRNPELSCEVAEREGFEPTGPKPQVIIILWTNGSPEWPSPPIASLESDQHCTALKRSGRAWTKLTDALKQAILSVVETGDLRTWIRRLLSLGFRNIGPLQHIVYSPDMFGPDLPFDC